MTTTAADLVAIDDAVAFLKAGDSDAPSIAGFLTAASAWCESYCGRPLRRRTVTNLRLTGPDGAQLFPPLFPIDPASAVTIKLDEATQTVWRTEADGDVDAKDVVCASSDPFDERVGLDHFYRRYGWTSALGWAWMSARNVSLGRNRVLLSYTGGYSPVPDDLQLACLYVLQKVWRDTDKQAGGVTLVTLPVGGSIQLAPDEVPKEAVRLLARYLRPIMAAV